MNPAITRTVKVIVRHSSMCKDKSKGAEWRKCRCSKTLLVYESDRGKNRRISAKTRSWERAEDAAQELRDSWDPRLQRLKKLESDKESESKRIDTAVALYIADMAARLGDNTWSESTLTYHTAPAASSVINSSGPPAAATWVTGDAS